MLFYICTLFSGARGSSHALGCGARRGAACTPRHNFGSRNLASNHGVAFRRARATQDHGNPTCQLLCCTAVKASLLCGSHSTTAIAHQVCVDHYACVDIAYACLCYDTYVCVSVGVCGSVYSCAGIPRFSVLFFWLCLLLLLLLLLLLPYHVCITPPLKLSSSPFCGRHGTTAVSYTHLTLPTKA